MGECNYNGTCSQCTRTGLEYIKTFEKLVCCVTDASVVPGWIEWRARSEEECPHEEGWPVSYILLTVFGVILLLGAVMWGTYRIIRRYQYRPIPHTRLASSTSTVSTIVEGGARWDEVELTEISTVAQDAIL